MTMKSETAIMAVLSTLFGIRVLAQLITTRFNIPHFPPFEAWHSNAMPYGLLLFFQLLILFTMVRAGMLAKAGRLHLAFSRWRWLLVFAWIYLLAMSTRLLLGLTVFEDVRWFANYLSTSFHIVLAGFIFVTASVIRKRLATKGECHA